MERKGSVLYCALSGAASAFHPPSPPEKQIKTIELTISLFSVFKTHSE